MKGADRVQNWSKTGGSWLPQPLPRQVSDISTSAYPSWLNLTKIAWWRLFERNLLISCFFSGWPALQVLPAEEWVEKENMFFLCIGIWQSRNPGESALRWLARGVPGLDGRFQVSSRVWRQREHLISTSEYNVPHYFTWPTEHYNYIYKLSFISPAETCTQSVGRRELVTHCRNLWLRKRLAGWVQ